MFSFPALPAGPPSRANWYKELLDHPDCQGSPTKVQEAYSSFRDGRFKEQVAAFVPKKESCAPSVTADEALLQHLKANDDNSDILDVQDINCLVIWARPSKQVLDLISGIQSRLHDFLGKDIYLMPTQDIHLSLLELSHRHPVTDLRSVADEIGRERLQDMLDYASHQSQKPGLVNPQLNFDSKGIAINFVPSALDPYTYHHLRSDLQNMALESGINIDTCYTAPSAHVTIGRFIGNELFKCPDGPERFVRFVEVVNKELEGLWQNSNKGLVWSVGEEKSLELQLGYLKFGRGRGKAGMVGLAVGLTI